MLALLLGGITTVAYGVVYGVWAFLVARLLWGTAWSFIRIEGMSTALDVASEETRGRYMGLFQAISRIGSAIALLAGGIFADAMAFAPHLSVRGVHLQCCAAGARREASAARHGHTPALPCDGTSSASTVHDNSACTRYADALAYGCSQFWDLQHISRQQPGLGHFGIHAAYALRGHADAGAVPVGMASLTGVLLSTRGFSRSWLRPSGRVSC